MRWAPPQVAGPKPRLYQGFLHQNAESPLIRSKASPFSLFLHLASITALRTTSNCFRSQATRSCEVARPYRSGLTCNLFVDFGSHKTNPKLSHSGAAVQTAVCSPLGGIGWLDSTKEKGSFVQDWQPLLCHHSELAPSSQGQGQGRRPGSRAAGVGWLQRAEQAGRSLRRNDLHPPSPLQQRSPTQGQSVWKQPQQSPALQLSLKTGEGMVSPSPALTSSCTE